MTYILFSIIFCKVDKNKNGKIDMSEAMELVKVISNLSNQAGAK